MEKAAFGAGQGVEGVLRQLDGVKTITAGKMDNHVEALLVDYDENKVTYEQLLDAFWASHDPTKSHSKSRAAIFTFSARQEELAEISKKALADSGKYDAPIATIVEPAQNFQSA